MSTPEEAQKAIDALNGTSIDGRAFNRQPRPPSRRTLCGGGVVAGADVVNTVAAVVAGAAAAGDGTAIKHWFYSILGPGFPGLIFHFGCVLFPGQWDVAFHHGPEHQEQL